MDERIRFLWWDIRWLTLYHTRRLVGWIIIWSTNKYIIIPDGIYWQLIRVQSSIIKVLDKLYRDYAH